MAATFFELIVAEQGRNAQRETSRENAGRLAYSIHKQDSKGVGYFQVQKPIPFDVAFTEEPVMFTGAAIIDPVPAGWYPPAAGASVWQWQRNPKGNYTGAWVALWVRMEPADAVSPTPPPIRIQHHLMFMGDAYKDLGNEVSTDAQLLSPRRAGFGS